MASVNEKFNTFVDTNLRGTIELLRLIHKQHGLPTDQTALALEKTVQQAKAQLQTIPEHLLEQYAAQFISGPVNPIDHNPPPPPYQPLPAPPPFQPPLQVKRDELRKCIQKDEWTMQNALIPALKRMHEEEQLDLPPIAILGNCHNPNYKKWVSNQFQGLVMEEKRGHLVDRLWRDLQAFKKETLLACAEFPDTHATYDVLIRCSSRLYDEPLPNAHAIVKEILNQFGSNQLVQGIAKLKELILENPTMANMLYDLYDVHTKDDARRRYRYAVM